MNLVVNLKITSGTIEYNLKDAKINFTDKVNIDDKKNGLVTLAKTSTVEFAFGGLGINNSYKLPKNLMFSKQNLAPGGSSTGSATAVYSGLAPMSVGTDTAGSVRIPAAWHSLVGFKPSYRKISTKGVLPLSKSFDEGVGRSVASFGDIGITNFINASYTGGLSLIHI